MNDKFTGKIDELELEKLAGDEQAVGGATPTVTVLITATIVATYTAGACPTSSCTKSCNK